MNKNRYFANNPTNIDIQRSRFNRASQHKTTLNTGDLVPIYVDEMLPGDTVKMDMSALVRMSTPIFPVMDNAFIEFFWFFVPYRLVWDHWKNFMGENTESAWTPKTEYEIPQITVGEDTELTKSTKVSKGTIADYMGIPTNVQHLHYSALPFRAYTLIWNEWFRSENLQDPVDIDKGDSNKAYVDPTESTYTDTAYAQYGGKLLRSCKPFDYFTGALPMPQKGEAVLLPLGTTAPIIGNGQPIELWGMTSEAGYQAWAGRANSGTGTNNEINITLSSDGTTAGDKPTYGEKLGLEETGTNSGMVADLSTATAATVNQLRQAFAVQRMLEKDARGGSRYTEIIRAHFGIISPDARQQRPEYLGGCKRAINVDQVIQTSSTDTTTPQGNTAAYSVTGVRDNKFIKSFTEHGLIMCLATIRTDHTYQQGLERFWSRTKRTDFYFPSLANIGEQAILNKEIYAQGTEKDNEAFGYQEAWADYRYKPNRVSGAMRSNYAQTLDSWHYADYYTAQPTLSAEWIEETRKNVDRTIAVSEQQEDQFIADFYFNCIMTRPMPLYSIPGLIDHH
nr:MAG TPA: Major capsid protein [Microviridae sp.]